MQTLELGTTTHLTCNEDTQHSGFTMNVWWNKYGIYMGNITKCACSETAWFITLRWIIRTKYVTYHPVQCSNDSVNFRLS